MRIRANDQNNDWQFGQSSGNYLTGVQAIAQDVQTRLQMFWGDCFYALQFGIQWFRWLSIKNPTAQNGVILQTRQMILGNVGGYPSSGTIAINAIDVFENPVTREMTLEYEVATIYSSTLNGSVSVPTGLGE